MASPLPKTASPAVGRPSAAEQTHPPAAARDTAATPQSGTPAGAGAAASSLRSMVSYESVKSLPAYIWSWVKLPFSAAASFIKDLWNRFSVWKWGQPEVIEPGDTIEITEKGYFWGETVKTYLIEELLNSGTHTLKDLMNINKEITEKNARKKGWEMVTVDSKTMTLKTAIEQGKITVADAIAKGSTDLPTAQINGWITVKVTHPATWYRGSREETMMLKRAYRKELITPDDAFKAANITDDKQRTKADVNWKKR